MHTMLNSAVVQCDSQLASQLLIAVLMNRNSIGDLFSFDFLKIFVVENWYERSQYIAYSLVLILSEVNYFRLIGFNLFDFVVLGRIKLCASARLDFRLDDYDMFFLWQVFL